MAFAPKPSYGTWNRTQQIGIALDTPFTFTEAISENFQQGVLDSFGLGSTIRSVIAGNPNARTGPEGLGAAIRELNELTGITPPDESKVLSLEDYKGSTWFRSEIPFEDGLTENRAAAKAAMYDKKQVRAAFSQRQPIAAFLGQLGGQALDPVNYVPVFGPGVKAAAIARTGSVAGRALLSASEAAVNTAAFGILTSNIRRQFGDDTSWESITTEVAMSAIIGGAFGGGIGLLARGADRRAAALARIQPKMQTIQNAMESRAALNDAVTGLIDSGEVRLGANSKETVTRLSDEVTARTAASRSLAAETATVQGSKAGEVVISPTGARVAVRPEVVEADTLIRAEGALQVRDRSSPQSAVQVEDIAINLDPARLMPNVDASQGAPLVGADNIIDSGNGRVMAIKRAYEAYPEKAAAYREALQAAGYDTTGMVAPVLVNRRLTPLSAEARVQFNSEVNGPTTARMSAVELAAMDRAALTDGVLDVLDDAPVTAASNRAAVGRFLANLPANERGALVDQGGNLSADGQRRMENALVAAAYGDSDTGVLRRFAEATDDNTRTIVGALSDVAGQWARMRRSIKAGEVTADFDMTPELTQAVRLLGRWREQAAAEGRPVSTVIREGLAQTDLLDGSISPEAQTFIRMFYQNDHFGRATGREELAARLQRVIDATLDLGRPSLFGDAITPTKGEVLTNAQRSQADIFAADGAEPRTEALGDSGEIREAGADGAGDRPGAAAGDPLAGRTITGVMTERFSGAGRPDEEAAAAGALVEAFYATMARRLGISADDLVARVGLPDVVRGGEAGPDAMMQGGIDSPEFRAWFGDSKVVDAEGKPLVVYHGTPNQFDAFSDKKLGKNTGADDPGIFFTSSRDVAEGFRGKRLFRKGQVIETYLSMQNPRIVDGTNIEAGSSAKWLILSQAQGDGFDGVIFKNMVETDYRGVGERRSDVYAVFNPTQIKSTANRGAFDAGDPRILFQVTPEQARAIDIETQMPADATFADAVKNTDGASITPDGLLIDLVRYQKPEQEGSTSVRTGVFYLPTGSASAKFYKGDKNAYGGKVEVKGETLIKRPIFVKGATGGKAPEAAYDAIKGKGAYEKMRTAVLKAIGGDKRTLDERGYNLLEEYGADGNMIWEIIPNSKEGNTLAYALQENIVAHAVREAGYDAVVGYSVGRGDKGAFISEVFDVREIDYPTPGERATLHPDFERNYRQGRNGVARGSISLDQNLIRLFETADASTALHETGHLFLGLYKRMADDPTAPEALRGEFETVKRWWSANAGDVARDANASGRADGVTDADVRAVLETGTSGDKAKDLAIDVGLHEQWARGFEAYLREGVAPTPGLRGIFEQFKRWLSSVYAKAQELNVNLSPDIRAVFDRMLTSEPVARQADEPSMFGDEPRQPLAALNFAEPMPDPVPDGLDAATTRIGKPETMKELAASHGVSEDGSYIEQADVDQLRTEGRLTPEDEAELAAADQMVADADAYADTLAVAARCVIS